jgi:NAD-dependent SIR2 family protein deacetylase
MSVDSGIPDFRGASGLWTAEKDNFMKFANGNAFHERPVEAWNFYITRLMRYSEVEPHSGYRDLKQLLDELNKDTYVITSNVDGHFKKSGYDPEKIYEIHGNLEFIQCADGCARDMLPMPIFQDSVADLNEIPKCRHCGSIMRPAVMMFNDPWFIITLVESQSQHCMKWLNDKKNVVGIELGAGLAVPSIRIHGQERTATLIRINPHDYQVNRPQDISIQATAVEGIDSLKQILG